MKVALRTSLQIYRREDGPGARRFLKRHAARAARYNARQLLANGIHEGFSNRVTRGWWS